MENFLLSVENALKSSFFQKDKIYLTYSEYLSFSVLPKRKYRNSFRDKLMRLSFINILAYHRAKRNFYKLFNMDDFLAYGNHFLENKNEYLELYCSLADKQSKDVLIEVLIARFTGDFRKALSKCKQYFEEDIIQFKPNEVFVDCGAWVGDSTDVFLSSNPYFATCYLIEPDLLSMARAKRNLKDKKGKFYFISTGVSDKNEVLPFVMSGGSGASFKNTLNSRNIMKLELDTIDNIVKEPATFIKMDLEGFEIKALLGAKQQISKYHPKLAICIYHKPDDFITIFNLIKSFDTINQYKYYIRHYNPMHNETVLYAIPK